MKLYLPVPPQECLLSYQSSQLHTAICSLRVIYGALRANSACNNVIWFLLFLCFVRQNRFHAQYLTESLFFVLPFLAKYHEGFSHSIKLYAKEYCQIYFVQPNQHHTAIITRRFFQ